MASPFRPFVGQDVTSLVILPLHQLQPSSLVPLSINALPSGRNFLTIIEATWPAPDHTISRLVLSPSLASLSQSQQQSRSPAKIELVAFSCTCKTNSNHQAHSNNHHDVADIVREPEGDGHTATNVEADAEEYGEEDAEYFEYTDSQDGEDYVDDLSEDEIEDQMQAEEMDQLHGAFCQHLSSMVSVIINSPESVIYNSATSFDELNPEIPDQQAMEQEVIDAAVSGAPSNVSLCSILPHAKSPCFTSSIFTHLHEMINIFVSDLRADVRLGAAWKGWERPIHVELRRKKNGFKLDRHRQSLFQLMEANCQFIMKIFGYECPISVDSADFNGKGWIYLVEMADAVSSNKEIFPEIESWMWSLSDSYSPRLEHQSYFGAILRQLDHALLHAASNIRSVSLLSAIPDSDLQRLKSEVLPNLVEMCETFSVDDGQGPLFVRPHDFINNIPFHRADIASIISGEKAVGGTAVQKMLPSESYFATQYRLCHLLEQKDYIGAAQLAFAFDSMDILAALALEADEEAFENHFAAMIEVIYSSPKTRLHQEIDPMSQQTIAHVTSIDPSEALPSYLTYRAAPRSEKSLHYSAKRLASAATTINMKPWVILFSLLDCGAMYESAAISSLNLLQTITNVPHIANLNQMLSNPSGQRSDKIPSLLFRSTQTAVYAAACVRPPPRKFDSPLVAAVHSISTPDLLSQLNALDWDAEACAHFRVTSIISMTFGFAIREACTSNPSRESVDHATRILSSLIPVLCTKSIEFGEYEVIWEALSTFVDATACRPYDKSRHLRLFCHALCHTPRRFVPLIASAILQVMHAENEASEAGYVVALMRFEVLGEIKHKNPALFHELLKDSTSIELFFSSSLELVPIFDNETEFLEQALNLVINMLHVTCSAPKVEEMYQSIRAVLLFMYESHEVPNRIIRLLAAHAISLKDCEILHESCRHWISFLLSTDCFSPAYCKANDTPQDPASKRMTHIFKKLIHYMHCIHSADDAVTQFEIDTIRSFLSNDINYSKFLPILCKYYGQDLLYTIIEPKIASEMALPQQLDCIFHLLGKKKEMLRLMDTWGCLDSDTSDVVSAKAERFFDFLRLYPSLTHVQDAMDQDAECKAAFVSKIIHITQSFCANPVSLAISSQNFYEDFRAFLGPISQSDSARAERPDASKRPRNQ